ncbi:hypothetical protein P152DRAFT_455546 [Eremomyces bilateralis CBS 781.70]|uniref:Zn(2)-C6 fungal-type domain-containing protein n=1 Tax=Eremomyces bilateralis CBS 781.70 TaxID=1392243 RepID=A0A6G1GCU8_9PEZI|nr:uncharacterized protein P152DRAFT_455546 [Eremomyces bilateralis CBS 781.70]KAF1815832.1 hypothetical protein P152DRAFT_455546 [Eremomyces bilateralis CBS 781.70]
MDYYGVWLDETISPFGPSPSLTAISDGGTGLNDGDMPLEALFEYSLDPNDGGNFTGDGPLMYRNETPPESIAGSFFSQDLEFPRLDTAAHSKPIDIPMSAPNGQIMVPKHWGSAKVDAELQKFPTWDPEYQPGENFFDQETELDNLSVVERPATDSVNVQFQYAQEQFDIPQSAHLSGNFSLLTSLFQHGQPIPIAPPKAAPAPPVLNTLPKPVNLLARKGSEKGKYAEKSRVTKQRSRASSFNGSNGNNVTSNNFMLYGHMEGSEHLRFIEGSNMKKPKGRKNALTPDQRRDAALVREMGACQSCKDRKCKCDQTVPCQACIRHYKTQLIYKPCRGFMLNSLVATLICAETFPTSRSLDRFLGKDQYWVCKEQQRMRFSFGFGESFTRNVRIVVPRNRSQLNHEHVVYPWPPKKDGTATKTHVNHKVLPVVLARTDDLFEMLDRYLERLVEDPENFRSFPVYASQLGVLRQIYMFKRRSQRPEADMLKQALKALVLVHTAGNIKVDVEDPGVKPIMAMHRVTDTTRVMPCFVRGQLGVVMPQLAKRLMDTTLKKMEPHLYSRDCEEWPLVLATFMVLLMTIESIQYHAAKEAYHALFDRISADPGAPAFSAHTGPHSSKIDDKTAVCLLEQYSKCFQKCHKKLTMTAPKTLASPSSVGSRADQEACDRFIDDLRSTIERCNPYLEQRCELKVDRADNMSFFFDRLVAKLLLLKF